MSLPMRAVALLGGAYLLSYLVFLAQGLGGNPLAAIFSAVYALSAITSVLMVRAILGLFIDFSRPVTFFRVLANITDPFIALIEPMTPKSVLDWARPFAAAFYVFMVSVVLFGGPPFFPAPPIWAMLVKPESLPEVARAYLFVWATSVGGGQPH